MTKGAILVTLACAAVIALISVAIKTRPSGTTLKESSGPMEMGNPLADPLLVEMMDDDGIKAGPTTDADLAVIQQGGEIRIVLSDALQKRLGSDCLVRLGMLGPDETMSSQRYRDFLKAMHDIIIESEARGDHHHHDDKGQKENATPH